MPPKDLTAPPSAARIPHPTTLHGTTLEDDYAWLRAKESPEVLAHLEAENAYTAAAMAGTEALQQALYDEILSHIQEDDVSVPYRDGDWEYLTRTEKGRQYPRYGRYPAGKPEQEAVILDVNLLAEDQAYMAVGALAISPDARLLAYTTDTTGFRQYTLHIRDLTTGLDLQDTAERVGSVAWAADSATLFFTTEDEQTKRQDRLFRLALGGAAVQVFEEPDERFNLGLGRTSDRRYLLLESGSHTTNEIRYLRSDRPEDDLRLFAPRIDDEEYHVDHRAGFFYIRTNHGAEQFRLMRVPASTVLSGADSAASKGTDPAALKGTDSAALKGTDSAALKRTDSAASKGTDSAALKGTDSADLKGTDSADLKGTGFSPSVGSAKEEGALAPEGIRELWLELIPENQDAPLEDFDLFQSFLVLSYRELGLPILRVFDLDAQGLPVAPRDIRFPDPAYSAYGEINRDFNATTFRYAYQSLVRPSSVFRYDVATGASTLLKEQAVPGGFDAANYTSERLWFPASDGTKVPVSLVYRKDKVRLDGQSPLYVYGYGSYGYALPLGFSASRLALLDRGIVVAYAHIRGGGELGDPWHDAGKMMAKRNTFTDFIEAVEFLLREGYGDPARVAIEGGSAGGLLMGAVVNFALEQGKPELFRAVLSHVPFVDVMNTMLDASLPLTVAEYEEWGNPNEPEAFRYMLSYSPYENLRPGPYPAMLVKTSLNDSQVMYWEPAKYVAKLRTLKTNDTPLLLHINMEAGHGGASGRYDYLKEIAFDDAFLLRELGLV